jgi:hypothetical protein
MLRIVAYASGPVMMTWALLVLADVVIGQLVDPPRLWPLLMYAWAIPLIVHMSAGLRRYARLPRPVWLALVAAAIGVLVALVASTLLWIRQFP